MSTLSHLPSRSGEFHPEQGLGTAGVARQTRETTRPRPQLHDYYRDLRAQEDEDFRKRYG